MHVMALKRQKTKQRGVSMIEALVALVVLALGVMGLAGIQTRTLLDSRSTNERAIAVRMAEDLNERMQVNTAVKFATPALNPNPYVVTWGAAATPTDCFANVCTGAQLAGFDIAQWKGVLSQLLPGGDARVFRSDTDANQFGVLIGWNARLAKNQDGTTGADLTVFTAPFAVNTGVAGVACPADLICHLVYIRP